jgi:hypothetical protein
MYHHIVAQASNGAVNIWVIYILVITVISFIFIFIFRAVLSIPSFLRYQKAQIRLLEEIAKTQGVDSTKVQSIISESIEWDSMKQ